MSIIHDALKKAQSSPQNPKTDPQSETAENPREMSSRNAVIFMISISLVVLFALAGLARIGWHSLAGNPHATARQQAALTIPIQAATNTVSPSTQPASADSVPAPADIISRSFKIEGILDHNGKIVALVNGKIVETGDRIGADTVSSINFSGITLSNGTNIRNIPVEQ